MDDGGGRLVKAILLAVLVLAGLSSAGLLSMFTPSNDEQPTTPGEGEGEGDNETDGGDQGGDGGDNGSSTPICPEGTIQYAWSCITPVSNLSYPAPQSHYIGTPLWLHPTWDGDHPNNWSADCGVGSSDSLTLYNNGSVLLYAIEAGPMLCNINGSNPVSSAESDIDVLFVFPPPSNIEYISDGFAMVLDQPFDSNPPSVIGGQVDSWEVFPQLPIGLSLHPETGAIQGIPYVLSAASVHKIWANNSGGSTSTNISLTIVDQPPRDLHWGLMNLVLTIGVEMAPQAATNIGGSPVTYEADPALPAGIELNSSTGRVSGIPAELWPETAHFVWANNSGGGAIAVLTITVNDERVTGIWYEHSPVDLIWNVDYADFLPQTFGGTPLSWSITPQLAGSLSFDTMSGRITGFADTLQPWTNHTVTASNTGGDTSIILQVRIADHTPSNISWPATEYILGANQSISLLATNDGPPIVGWQVEPALPVGLILNVSTGEISGTPPGRATNRHAWTTHTVWANNSGGSLATNFTFAIHDLAADHSELTARPVGSVDFGGAWPSLILPIGDWAFGVGIDWDNRPISSASHAGKGRIVGYGHETMVARTGTDSRANLSLNALDWVCDRSSDNAGQARTVGLEASFGGWKDALLTEGYSVIELATPADLPNLDCFVTEFWNSYSDTENQQITQWLVEGGGLVMGGHAWYWSYSNSDVAHNYPGNKIAKQTGLFVSASSGSSTFSVNVNQWGELYRLHGSLPQIEDHVFGTQMMTPADADIAATTVNLCVSNLPLDYTGVWARLRAMVNATGWYHINSSNAFTLNADEIDDLLLNIQERLMQTLPAAELFVHPSSSSFPGSVSPTAPRLNRTMVIDGDYEGLPSSFGYAGARAHGRMSTGLYAAPGEVVNVIFPSGLVNQNVYVLVGAHTDSLWGKTTLNRHPQVHRWWYVDSTSMQVGNAFGGAIYIAIAAGSSLGEFNVTIENAVEMPWYRHGITNLSNWQLVLRNAPAPTAELSSGFFILTVPSSYIRNLDDPDYAMEFWDTALQMEHNLSGYTPWPRIERAVFDVQISAGWMHSGYPFMAHTASVAGVVNGTYMYENGDWGMFHELGHNHQWMSATLPGNTETTCNLFSVYLMEDLVGSSGHGAMSPSSRQSRTETYFSGGAQIASWSVWTALETHIQIKEEFGWAPFTAAFREYYYNYSSQPSGDSAEFNQWAIQISLNTGHNLMPYLAAWGFPLIQSSWDAVDHLPVWNTDPLRGWVYEYDLITRNYAVANVSSSAADLEWEVYDNGTNTTLTVCWGLFDGGNSTVSWTNCASIGQSSVGDWQHSVSDLLTGQTYHWRVMGENDNGQTWSDDSTFTTS